MRKTSWMARVIVPPLPAGGERIEVRGSIDLALGANPHPTLSLTKGEEACTNALTSGVDGGASSCEPFDLAASQSSALHSFRK
jgi:hypothetical protein